jgi:hypothetical protein
MTFCGLNNRILALEGGEERHDSRGCYTVSQTGADKRMRDGNYGIVYDLVL